MNKNAIIVAGERLEDLDESLRPGTWDLGHGTWDLGPGTGVGQILSLHLVLTNPVYLPR